ncbi:MAG: Ku protein [Planctomycetes bacterium]|nr:Ku protein [Planctomycetota bacterium]
MPPRAMWTGQLRLSLVSFGVRLYAATESANRVSMNQLHKDCHQRLRNQLTCPVHGAVNRDEIAKGYDYEKDSYVIIEAPDLEAIRLPSSKAIELVQFVKADEIDPLFVNAPYYLGPDGPVAEDAFRVIREAMQRAGLVGIGKVVMKGREQLVALNVSGKGFLLTTLRYASEVRSPEQYFADVKEGDVDEEQVALAASIMQAKAAPFEPSEYTDKYQAEFFAVVKRKIEGEKPIVVEDDEPVAAFNFMDALKKSVADADTGTGRTTKKKTTKTKKKTAPKKPAARSVAAARKKKKKGA